MLRKPGLARDRLDLDRAAEDLRHLELEQASQQVLVRARDRDLRSAAGLVHLQQVDLEALAGAVVLDAHLLGRRQHRLRLAEVDVDVARLEAVDDAGDDVAFLAGVLLEDDLALGLAQALQDDLLRRLGGDAAGVLRASLRC